MYRINATIEGVAPLLMNKIADLDALESPSKGGKKTAQAKLDEAHLKVHRNSSGIYMPAWNLKCVLIDGARRGGVKEGRGSIAPYLQATVFPEDALFGTDQPDGIHVHPGKIPPRTGGYVLIRRPMFNAGWKLTLRFNVTDDRRSPDSIRRALEEAGALVGLGSWRPEYGRFIVTDWSITQGT